MECKKWRPSGVLVLEWRLTIRKERAVLYSAHLAVAPTDRFDELFRRLYPSLFGLA